MNLPVILHINTFEQGQSVERACKLARTLGVDGLEFRRKPKGYPGSDLAYLDELSRALDRHPLEWVIFGSPGVNLLSDDPEVRARELDGAEAFYRKAASRFPLRLANTFSTELIHPDASIPLRQYWRHGSALATEEQWRNTICGFRRLGKLAQELKFRFAFESHGLYLHDTVDSCMRLVEGIGSDQVGLLWDHVNLFLFENPPGMDEVIRRFGSKLFYVHLKNQLLPAGPVRPASSLGGGILNIRDQIRKLLAAGYAGPLCIESPRQGDREYFVREDLGYLRQVMAELLEEREEAAPTGSR